MSGTQPPCGWGQDTGVAEGHEAGSSSLVGLLHGGRHELLMVCCCCGLSHTTRTQLLRQRSERALRMRQRWQLPGGLEPRKPPAVLIELHFLLSNTCDRIWLLLSPVSMTSFACLVLR